MLNRGHNIFRLDLLILHFLQQTNAFFIINKDFTMHMCVIIILLILKFNQTYNYMLEN